MSDERGRGVNGQLIVETVLVAEVDRIFLLLYFFEQ